MKNLAVREFWKRRKETASDLLQGTILVLGLSWLFYDSFFTVLFLLPLIWFRHRECAEARRKRKEEQFLKQFREWILLLSSSLSAGYSVENAFGQSFRELQLMFPRGGPMLNELRGMLAKAENNQSPEILLNDLAGRYPLGEVVSFAEVFRTARSSGGSLNAIIRSTASRMAEVMDTKREIETLLSAKVYEQKIMTVMPAAVLLYIRLGSEEFLNGLYHNPAGAGIMTLCLGIYLSAYLLGKRMVQFEI